MTTIEIIHKAFDVYCNLIYNRTYPYTENNLYQFLEEMWNEFLIENPGHIKYDKQCYRILITHVEKSHDFIRINLTNFIKQHEQSRI